MSDQAAQPVCPTCTQPATQAMGPDGGWECRNEACPEFGQPLQADEPERDEPASPTPLRERLDGGRVASG